LGTQFDTTTNKKHKVSPPLSPRRVPKKRSSTMKRDTMRLMLSSIVLGLSVFLLVGMESPSPWQSATITRSLRETSHEAKKRPKRMHTFFDILKKDRESIEHRPLLDLWEKTWKDAGWEPRILTLDDAKKHPEYDRIANRLNNTLMKGDRYNTLCIIRWLAMAQVGGGWMSDYDNFPIRKFDAYPLPNDGNLTVHDLHVPDLVSGSSSEYLRMTNMIVESVVEKDVEARQKSASEQEKIGKSGGPLWSDMLALAAFIKDQPESYQRGQRVFQVFSTSTTAEDLNKDHWDEEFCRLHTPPSIVAVHVAHASAHRGFKRGQLHPGQTHHLRTPIAEEWLEKWRISCGNITYTAEKEA